ncbi:MAG: hypothetical protein J7M25_09395 [Deltaproteobacteria bacterium]|nr:hypothetical protein [Deltaproteobacteria bacterium]
MTSTGYALAKKLVASQVEYSVARHLLAWVILGVSVLLDAATTAYVASRSGLDAAVVFRPWATGMTNMDLRDDHLAFVRRHIETLLVDGAERVPQDQAAIIDSLHLTDKLFFLDQVPSDRIGLVEQVFGGR